ncbi:hypothetical protein P9E08_08885 [Bacillus mojavensis]|uniref:hypothetical protein n=1 Tax=Bacillus mojavensis TaxID=72360 RepID=UPI002DB81467|nr:hypothetical protein [Bacillus mojavensis]MEC1625494.1 hypothetical protein [Bacillus mojavensis]
MKPTITKQQAEAIEYLRNIGDMSDEWFLFKYTNVYFGNEPDHVAFGPIASMDIMTLAAALVNGYEVEKTPEERVREYYYDLRRAEDRLEERGESGSQFRQGWQSVGETLNLLGIKIEGVNA